MDDWRALLTDKEKSAIETVGTFSCLTLFSFLKSLENVSSCSSDYRGSSTGIHFVIFLGTDTRSIFIY